MCLLAGCGAQSPKVETAGAGRQPLPAAAASDSTFLWEVRLPDRPGRVFVLGSVHLRSLQDASLDLAVTDAITGAHTVALEIVPDEVDQSEVQRFVMERGMLPEGDSLSRHISAETYEALRKTIEPLGQPMALYDRMRPWFAALTVSMAKMSGQGFSADAGVDKMVTLLARAEPSRERKLLGLETVMEQMKTLEAAMTGDTGDAMVAEALRAAESNETATLMALYRTGNEAGIAAYFEQERKAHPETEQAMALLLDERNATMVKRMRPFFDEPGDTVVAVGAAHLPGNEGVLQRLHALGAQVAPVAAKGPAPEQVMSMARAAPPEPKIFTSKEAGFRIRILGEAQAQPSPVPGGHAFLVAVGNRGVLTMTSIPRAQTNRSLSFNELATTMASAVYGQLKMQPGPSSVVDLGKLEAVRVDAKSAAGSNGHLLVVGSEHRIYSLAAVSLTNNDEVQALMGALFEMMVTSFEVLD